MTSTTELPALRAMFADLGVPTDGSEYLVDEGGMINLREVGFLKNKYVYQLIQYVTRPGEMHAIMTDAVPEIVTAGQVGLPYAPCYS
jgi:hypothetical protein